MSGFSPQSKIANPVPDELEKKIQGINSYLVDGRVELDRLEKEKVDLIQDIADLKKDQMVLTTDMTSLQDKVDLLEKAKAELENRINQCRNELLLEGTKLADAVKNREAEEMKTASISSDLDKRTKEVEDKESAMRVYAKSLEEKEKKLDAYADKLKRFVDQVKA